VVQYVWSGEHKREDRQRKTIQRHSLEAVQSPLAAPGASVQEADLPDISTDGKRDLQSMLTPGLHQQYSDSNHAELTRTRTAPKTYLIQYMQAEH
jgi:phosphoribosyl-dephospho-CoA transferase